MLRNWWGWGKAVSMQHVNLVGVGTKATCNSVVSLDRPGEEQLEDGIGGMVTCYPCSNSRKWELRATAF